MGGWYLVIIFVFIGIGIVVFFVDLGLMGDSLLFIGSVECGSRCSFEVS